MRVLLVDDHTAVRGALRHLVEHGLGQEVVGEAGDGREAVALAEALQPDLVLLDVQMPDVPGPEAAAAISAALPGARVVALTAAADPATVAAMIAAGADSYLVKTAPPDELRAALRRILAGEAVLAPEVLPGVVADLAQRLRAEHERAEALSTLSRAKQEFLSLVSDRLATPLTAIAGYTKTLAERWDHLDEATKREFLGAVDRQCDRLAGRLEQITAVARLHQDGAATGLTFRLDAVAREVVGQVGGHADIDRRLCPLALGGVEVAGDRTAIWGVVRSLLDNAILYTDGPVAMTVRTVDGLGVLEVRDEGPGMAPGLAAALTEPFVTGDTTDASGHEGLGLSLYAAARVLELSRGRLVLDSDPERGTVAALHLPLARP